MRRSRPPHPTQATPSSPTSSPQAAKISADADTASYGSSLARLLRERTWAQLAEISVVFATAIGILALGSSASRGNPVTQTVVVLVANAAMLGVVWLGVRVRGQLLAHFGFSLRWAGRGRAWTTVWQSLIVFVAGVIAFVAGGALATHLVAQTQPADMSQYNPMAGNLPLLLVSLPVVWFFASFGEELLYRGFLIVRLTEIFGNTRLGRWAAVASSAVVFGAAHYSWGPTGMIQTAFMGLALGIAYLSVGRNLWVTILAHGYMDTLLFLQMYLRSPP